MQRPSGRSNTGPANVSRGPVLTTIGPSGPPTAAIVSVLTPTYRVLTVTPQNLSINGLYIRVNRATGTGSPNRTTPSCRAVTYPGPHSRCGSTGLAVAAWAAGAAPTVAASAA